MCSWDIDSATLFHDCGRQARAQPGATADREPGAPARQQEYGDNSAARLAAEARPRETVNHGWRLELRFPGKGWTGRSRAWAAGSIRGPGDELEPRNPRDLEETTLQVREGMDRCLLEEIRIDNRLDGAILTCVCALSEL